jgi:hypothetical protein
VSDSQSQNVTYVCGDPGCVCVPYAPLGLRWHRPSFRAAPSEGPTPALPVPAQEAEAERLLRMIRANCRVIYYPPDGMYPLEHAPHARKDMWDAIIYALREQSPAAPTVPETSNVRE